MPGLQASSVMTLGHRIPRGLEPGARNLAPDLSLFVGRPDYPGDSVLFFCENIFAVVIIINRYKMSYHFVLA